MQQSNKKAKQSKEPVRRNILFRIFKCCLVTFLCIIISTLLWVTVYAFLPVPGTPLMLIKKFNEGIPINHSWTPIEKIAPDMAIAVISSEDSHFTQHNGFDWEQIKKAREEAKKGKRVRGASTISQQTAKNVFLWNSRTWTRKGLEAYFTVLIEFIWGKERIMEVYLNSIEMGKGLYGIAAVSKEHFNKTPDKLTRAECALIAATLPNPILYSSKKPTKFVKSRQKKILSEMDFIEKMIKQENGKKKIK